MITQRATDRRIDTPVLESNDEHTEPAKLTAAVEEFIDPRAQKRVLELVGKLDWDMPYDHKAERSRR